MALFQRILSQCFCWLPCFGAGETSIQYNSSSQRSFWQKSARHLFGEFSMATVQANLHNEDRCQLVSGNLTDNADGPRGVFVGVYDGHGATKCSQFLLENLFNNLKSAIANQLDEDAVRNAYDVTENTFVQLVRDNWHQQVELAMTGSCCLVGLVHDNVLYVANAGDSRAVLARGPALEAVQLSIDYDANDSNRRVEVLEEHPGRNENDLFTHVNQSWRVGGILQVTRAIGDVYLKYNEFNCDRLPARFRQQEDIVEPILKAKPTVQRHQLSHNDRFVIFASDGLWDEMGNMEAVEIVNSIPDRDRTLAAATLIKKALERAAARWEIEYRHLRCIQPYARRFFHDDISVVVLFFDHPAPAPAPGTGPAPVAAPAQAPAPAAAPAPDSAPAPGTGPAPAPEAEASMNRVQEQSNSGATTNVLEDFSAL